MFDQLKSWLLWNGSRTKIPSKDVTIDQHWVGNAALDDSELWEAISSQQQAISTGVEQLTSQHPVQQQSTQDATATCVKQLTAPRPVQQQLTQDATSTRVEQVTAPHLVQHQSTQDATSTRQVPCPVQQQSTQVATSKDVTSPCPVQHQSLQQFHQKTTATTTSDSKHNISISFILILYSNNIFIFSCKDFYISKYIFRKPLLSSQLTC